MYRRPTFWLTSLKKPANFIVASSLEVGTAHPQEYPKHDIWSNRYNVPNATTQQAILELEVGNGKRVNTVSELISDLKADY